MSYAWLDAWLKVVVKCLSCGKTSERFILKNDYEENEKENKSQIFSLFCQKCGKPHPHKLKKVLGIHNPRLNKIEKYNFYSEKVVFS